MSLTTSRQRSDSLPSGGTISHWPTRSRLTTDDVDNDSVFEHNSGQKRTGFASPFDDNRPPPFDINHATPSHPDIGFGATDESEDDDGDQNNNDLVQATDDEASFKDEISEISRSPLVENERKHIYLPNHMVHPDWCEYLKSEKDLETAWRILRDKVQAHVMHHRFVPVPRLGRSYTKFFEPWSAFAKRRNTNRRNLMRTTIRRVMPRTRPATEWKPILVPLGHIHLVSDWASTGNNAKMNVKWRTEHCDRHLIREEKRDREGVIKSIELKMRDSYIKSVPVIGPREIGLDLDRIAYMTLRHEVPHDKNADIIKASRFLKPGRNAIKPSAEQSQPVHKDNYPNVLYIVHEALYCGRMEMTLRVGGMSYTYMAVDQLIGTNFSQYKEFGVKGILRYPERLLAGYNFRPTFAGPDQMRFWIDARRYYYSPTLHIDQPTDWIERCHTVRAHETQEEKETRMNTIPHYLQNYALTQAEMDKLNEGIAIEPNRPNARRGARQPKRPLAKALTTGGAMRTHTRKPTYLEPAVDVAPAQSAFNNMTAGSGKNRTYVEAITSPDYFERRRLSYDDADSSQTRSRSRSRLADRPPPPDFSFGSRLDATQRSETTFGGKDSSTRNNSANDTTPDTKRKGNRRTSNRSSTDSGAIKDFLTVSNVDSGNRSRNRTGREERYEMIERQSEN